MKRFEFKLQPLLNYRQYLERLAQQETAKAQLDVKSCENRISHLGKTYDDQFEQIEKNLENGMTASGFKTCCDYLQTVENQIKDESQRKIQLKKILKEKVTALKKKSVDKKAMELYREKLRTVYQQEFIKAEQKELDDMVSIKGARKISNESV